MIVFFAATSLISCENKPAAVSQPTVTVTVTPTAAEPKIHHEKSTEIKSKESTAPVKAQEKSASSIKKIDFANTYLPVNDRCLEENENQVLDSAGISAEDECWIKVRNGKSDPKYKVGSSEMFKLIEIPEQLLDYYEDISADGKIAYVDVNGDGLTDAVFYGFTPDIVGLYVAFGNSKSPESPMYSLVYEGRAFAAYWKNEKQAFRMSGGKNKCEEGEKKFSHSPDGTPISLPEKWGDPCL